MFIMSVRVFISYVAGYLFDLTQSYDIPLYVAGSLEAAGGLLMCFIPLVQRRKPSPSITSASS